MKSLLEHLTECMVNEAGWYGAGGSIKYKIAPVINEIWKKSDMTKFITDFTKLFQKITGNEHINLYDYNEWMESNEYEGKLTVGKQWHVIDYDDADIEKIAKYFKSTYGIKQHGGHVCSIDKAIPIGKPNDIDSWPPKEIHVLVCVTNGDIRIYTVAFVDEIQDKWDKYNPTATFNFKKFGTPGGLNDAAGRTLQVGDIVAFMRRAGTGGMELGIISKLGNKRPNIQTESGNSVSLDGTQICLIQRGNNVVQ